VRPSEVARWPAWEVDLLENFLAKEPAAEQRIEVAIAHLTALYVTAHQQKNASPKRITDFMLYLKAWPAESEGQYSDVDREVLQELL
jgi:hypothetical protein